MNIIDKFHNWRRKQRWDRQYKSGRWNNLKKPIEASRYKTIINFISKYAKQQPSILDLGSGEGVLNEYMDSNAYSFFLGMDFSKVSIEKAKAKQFPNSEFISADLHFFTPEKTFDVIIFNEAFYYIHDSEKSNVLLRILNHLKEDGILIVSIFREGDGCWAHFNDLERLNHKVVKTENENTYWKIGVYKK